MVIDPRPRVPLPRLTPAEAEPYNRIIPANGGRDVFSRTFLIVAVAIAGAVGLFVGAVVGGLAVYRATHRSASAASGVPIETEDRRPFASLTADELCQQFKSNSARFWATYEGRYLTVGGAVDSVKVAGYTHRGRFVEEDAMWFQFHSGMFLICFFENAAELKALNPGERVTVVGKAAKDSDGGFILTSCRIANAAAGRR